MRSGGHLPSSCLIATLGSEAQVVTAALDLLLARGENIGRAVVLHTVAPGTPVAEALERLQLAFAEVAYAGKVALQLSPITVPGGHPLEDVRSPDEARAAFCCLYNQVRLAKLSAQRVHLSIAGGRKSLALFGMAAAQMLFDAGDHLWHLHSEGEFLTSKRLHPVPGDEVRLVEIPFMPWSQVDPILTGYAEIDDPFEAFERARALQLADKLETTRAFVLGALTVAERRVVSLLAQEGLSDQEIAARLYLSPRTVEEHLRSAYAKAQAHWELARVDRASLIALLNLYFATQITGNPA